MTTRLLVLSGSAVRSVLGYAECAGAMRDALIARANGQVFQPLRSVLKPPGAPGLMAVMPAYQHGQPAGYGLKAITITPANPAAGLDTHQGIVLLSSSETGQPLAVLNASAVTEIRTAAVSAVATDALANEDADVLAIIGTGVQARSHFLAITSTRKLAEVRIAATDHGKAQRLAADLAPLAGDTKLIPARTVEEAVLGAGIVVTATNSAAPVLRREWLRPGTHLNAVGACLPDQRELDTVTVAGAALYVDSRESVIAEAGDYVLAAAEGAIGPDHIKAELGDLLAGKPGVRGRAGERELTLFESVGLAVEDLAAAALAYEIARETGTGTLTDFG